MLSPSIIRQPGDAEFEAHASLTSRHEAYLEALRRHASLLRDLDQTMRGIADALDATDIDADRRGALTLSLDAHIGRARIAIADIDRTLTVALGTAGIVRH